MADQYLIDKSIQILQASYRAVALTGAGISTPSGIPDFRSPISGVWKNFDPMQVASIHAFKRKPQDFYNWIYPLADRILNAQPNAAHYALSTLEVAGPLQAVITQNIDMLHHRANSQKIYEVHGHLRKALCLDCGYEKKAVRLMADFVATGEMPLCEVCGGVLKPNITLFGEIPPLFVFQEAEQWASTCDLMIIAGSSLQVIPVADLPLLAKQNGAKLIIVNQSATYADEFADVVIRDDVATILPKLARPFA